MDTTNVDFRQFDFSLPITGAIGPFSGLDLFTELPDDAAKRAATEIWLKNW